MAGFSSFLLGFKPKVEKIFYFFKPLFSNVNTLNEASAENVDIVWNKFIVGLNSCSDLDDELVEFFQL